MTEQRGEQYEKRVDYIQKDADEQTATGVVMVPYTVDHHGDWERPETIEAFATQFDAFVDAGEADGGVMHAVWPSEWMTLERNEVLDTAEEIGGQSVDEGAWVQEWSYNDDELWSLVEDGILDGHSIGAVDVVWEPTGDDPDDLPEEVSVPDEVDVEEYWELTDGLIREVSAVDVPAVPDARILEASKARAATAEKRLADHLGNRSAFIEEAMERGHTETEAERLWDVLSRAVNVEGAGEPGEKSLTSAAKSFLNTLTNGWGTSPSTLQGGATAAKGASSPSRDAAHVSKEDTVGVDVFRITASEDDDTDYNGDLLGMGVDFPEHDVYVDWRRDAFPDALEDPHVSIYGSVEDLQQATGNDIESLDSVESPTDGFAAEAQRIRRKAVEQSEKYASEGDTSDDNTTMSDSEPPEWAKELQEQINEQSKRIDDVLAEGSEKDANGETDAFEDAPEWAKELKEDVDKQSERIDNISKQTGATESQQLTGTEKSGAGEGGVDERAAFFTPESKMHELANSGGRGGR
ncbi:XkdF-like putative serine protease domain-containing protein [Halobacterium sp. CBA1126]|uniref:XkdF-like putative serine protease domain-containing protein n=1 Tax=Halobacterium sp. CBA1126 TaxID=2668074 RepID=UPI0018D25BE4|nr:XkdF-like putative serine protease domain-containing protein [Halobacterium sp. CBA1126]